jgi:hypothetical protein
MGEMDVKGGSQENPFPIEGAPNKREEWFQWSVVSRNVGEK